MKMRSRILGHVENVIAINCYKPANTDRRKTEGCDALLKDITDFVWDDLNFY